MINHRTRSLIFGVLPDRIQARLFLLITLTLIPLVLLIGWVYVERYEIQRTQAVQTELKVAQGIANTFAARMSDIRRHDRTVGEVILSLSAFPDADVRRILLFNAEQFRAVRSLSWVSPQGIVLSSSDEDLIGEDLSEYSDFQGIKADQGWALGEFVRAGEDSQAPAFAVATAIRGDSGTLKGVVVSGIEPSELDDAIYPYIRPDGGAYAIFDRRGTLVYRSPNMDLSWDERVQWQERDPLLKRALDTGQQQSGIVRLDISAGEWISARVPVSETGWVAGAGRPLELALAPVRQRLIFDAGLTILVASAAFLLAALLASSIARPIRRLDRDAKAMGQGRVEELESPGAPAEVRRLRATVTGMATDLLRRAEDLRISEESFRQLADSMPQLVWSADPTGRIDYCNERHREYKEVIQGPGGSCKWVSVLHPDDVEKTTEDWHTAIRTGSNYQVEHRIQRIDGSFSWFLSRATPIRNRDGRIIRWFGTATDIEDLKKAEMEIENAKKAAEEASRAKSEFLANMSHEIRTPMTVFMAAIEHLLQIDKDRERRNLLEMADQSANRLRILIEEILDFSRIEARRVELEEEPFDLRTCVREAVDMFALPAREKNLRLETEVAPDVPEILIGDPGRLGQVLLNLVGNAVKFTHEGEVRIRVRTRNDSLEVTVVDTGIGIPEEKLNLLFRSFSQVDGSFTRKYGGTGLGLAISKGLVELMGGQIAVRSREEKGSVFTFTLPLKVAEEFYPAPVENGTGEGDRIISTRILLVEDDPMIQKMLTLMLARRGCKAEVANTGKEGLDKWEEGRFDILLMDLQMPEMDGLEATRKIRKRETEGGPRTSIIGLTAHARGEIKEECLSAGMDDVLIKPVQMNDFYSAIENCLSE